MKKNKCLMIALLMLFICLFSSCLGPEAQKLFNAIDSKIWVSESPFMWFCDAFGQTYIDDEVVDIMIGWGYDCYTHMHFCYDYFDTETGAITSDFTDDGYYGYAKYSTRQDRIFMNATRQIDGEKVARYDSIEFIGYTEEEFAEKYPQFEFMTRDEYLQSNWPERYPSADVNKLMEESLWICEEPLMWTKGECGQLELDGEILDIYCRDIGHFEIRSLADWYNINNEGYPKFLLSNADIYQHRTSGEIIVTSSSEYEYPLSQYKQMIFKEISEEEFAAKYPQFNLFTLDEYEKEHKVGDYREK